MVRVHSREQSGGMVVRGLGVEDVAESIGKVVEADAIVVVEFGVLVAVSVEMLEAGGKVPELGAVEVRIEDGCVSGEEAEGCGLNR